MDDTDDIHVYIRTLRHKFDNLKVAERKVLLQKIINSVRSSNTVIALSTGDDDERFCSWRKLTSLLLELANTELIKLNDSVRKKVEKGKIATDKPEVFYAYKTVVHEALKVRDSGVDGCSAVQFIVDALGNQGLINIYGTAVLSLLSKELLVFDEVTVHLSNDNWNDLIAVAFELIKLRSKNDGELRIDEKMLLQVARQLIEKASIQCPLNVSCVIDEFRQLLPFLSTKRVLYIECIVSCMLCLIAKFGVDHRINLIKLCDQIWLEILPNFQFDVASPNAFQRDVTKFFISVCVLHHPYCNITNCIADLNNDQWKKLVSDTFAEMFAVIESLIRKPSAVAKNWKLFTEFLDLGCRLLLLLLQWETGNLSIDETLSSKSLELSATTPRRRSVLLTWSSFMDMVESTGLKDTWIYFHFLEHMLCYFHRQISDENLVICMSRLIDMLPRLRKPDVLQAALKAIIPGIAPIRRSPELSSTLWLRLWQHALKLLPIKSCQANAYDVVSAMLEWRLICDPRADLKVLYGSTNQLPSQQSCAALLNYLVNYDFAESYVPGCCSESTDNSVNSAAQFSLRRSFLSSLFDNRAAAYLCDEEDNFFGMRCLNNVHPFLVAQLCRALMLVEPNTVKVNNSFATATKYVLEPSNELAEVEQILSKLDCVDSAEKSHLSLTTASEQMHAKTESSAVPETLLLLHEQLCTVIEDILNSESIEFDCLLRHWQFLLVIVPYLESAISSIIPYFQKLHSKVLSACKVDSSYRNLLVMSFYEVTTLWEDTKLAIPVNLIDNDLLDVLSASLFDKNFENNRKRISLQMAESPRSKRRRCLEPLFNAADQTSSLFSPTSPTSFVFDNVGASTQSPAPEVLKPDNKAKQATLEDNIRIRCMSGKILLNPLPCIKSLFHNYEEYLLSVFDKFRKCNDDLLTEFSEFRVFINCVDIFLTSNIDSEHVFLRLWNLIRNILQQTFKDVSKCIFLVNLFCKVPKLSCFSNAAVQNAFFTSFRGFWKLENDKKIKYPPTVKKLLATCICIVLQTKDTNCLNTALLDPDATISSEAKRICSSAPPNIAIAVAPSLPLILNDQNDMFDFLQLCESTLTQLELSSEDRFNLELSHLSSLIEILRSDKHTRYSRFVLWHIVQCIYKKHYTERFLKSLAFGKDYERLLNECIDYLLSQWLRCQYPVEDLATTILKMDFEELLRVGDVLEKSQRQLVELSFASVHGKFMCGATVSGDILVKRACEDAIDFGKQQLSSVTYDSLDRSLLLDIVFDLFDNLSCLKWPSECFFGAITVEEFDVYMEIMLKNRGYSSLALMLLKHSSDSLQILQLKFRNRLIHGCDKDTSFLCYKTFLSHINLRDLRNFADYFVRDVLLLLWDFLNVISNSLMLEVLELIASFLKSTQQPGVKVIDMSVGLSAVVCLCTDLLQKNCFIEEVTSILDVIFSIEECERLPLLPEFSVVSVQLYRKRQEEARNLSCWSTEKAIDWFNSVDSRFITNNDLNYLMKFDYHTVSCDCEEKGSTAIEKLKRMLNSHLRLNALALLGELAPLVLNCKSLRCLPRKSLELVVLQQIDSAMCSSNADVVSSAADVLSNICNLKNLCDLWPKLSSQFPCLHPFLSCKKRVGLFKIEKTTPDPSMIFCIGQETMFQSWVVAVYRQLASDRWECNPLILELLPLCQKCTGICAEVFPFLLESWFTLNGKNAAAITWLCEGLSAFVASSLAMKIEDSICVQRSTEVVLNGLQFIRLSQVSVEATWKLFESLDLLSLSELALRVGAAEDAVLFAQIHVDMQRTAEDEYLALISLRRENLLHAVTARHPESSRCGNLLLESAMVLKNTEMVYGLGEEVLAQTKTRIHLCEVECDWIKVLQIYSSLSVSDVMEKTACKKIFERLDFSGVSSSPQSLTFCYERAWKLAQWDCVEQPKLIDSVFTFTDVHKYLYSGFSNLFSDEVPALYVTRIAKAVRGVCLNGFEKLAVNRTSENLICLYLGAANMMEDLCSWKTEKIGALINQLKDEVHFSDFGFEETDTILSCRLLAASFLVRKTHNEKSCVEALKKVAVQKMDFCNRHRLYNQADNVIRAVEQCCKSTNSDFLKIERAKSLWARGDVHAAVHEMKLYVEQTSDLLKRNCDTTTKLDYSSILLTYGNWRIELNSEFHQQILDECHKQALELLEPLAEPGLEDRIDQKLSDVYLTLARYADDQYKRIDSFLTSSDCKERKTLLDSHEHQVKDQGNQMRSSPADNRTIMAFRFGQHEVERGKKEVEDLEKRRNEFLHLAVKHYLDVMEKTYGDELVVFRVLDLWFGNITDAVVCSVVQKHCQRIPPHKWLWVWTQLTARLTNKAGDHTKIFKKTLDEIVLGVVQLYPYQTFYTIYALSMDSQSLSFKRSSAAKEIITKLKSSSVAGIVGDMKLLADALCAVIDISVKSGITKMPACFSKIGSKTKIAVPTMSHSIHQSLNSYTFIVKYENQFEFTASGINAPKVLKCICSDGVTRKQLVKGNDDLRQDAILEQVFDIANRLLKRSSQSDYADSLIRTYSVIPLSPNKGIIEWLDGTIVLAEYLVGADFSSGAHERYYHKDGKYSTIMGRFKQLHKESRLHAEKYEAFEYFCKRFRPVFRYFFYEHFKEASAWYRARERYTKNVAASSMVGHILGIGDRHNSNILIDRITGELIHIDLGIAFELGRSLPVPELVPFRLTRDIIDPMGCSGVEGVFRRSCEHVLGILRDSSRILLPIISVLVYDPVSTWSISASKVKKLQSDVETISANFGHPDPDRNVVAQRVLFRVKDKLDGREELEHLSVRGQVNFLIKTARDAVNLSKIYYGWGPLL